MNINILHLDSFNPFIKEEKDDRVDQVYFFGVNVVELVYDPKTDNIITLKLNDNVVDYNDTNKIDQLNEHLDKCAKESERDFNYEYNIHVSGIDAFTKEVDNEKTDYFVVGEESYVIIYDKDTYEIKKVLINGEETPIKSMEDINKINRKIDSFRFKKWLELDKMKQ